MKLSEVMRLGTMTVPPVHGPIFDWSEEPDNWDVCAACAVGTFGVGMFGIQATAKLTSLYGDIGSYAQIRKMLDEHWPWTRKHVLHPVRGTKTSFMMTAITLFESHGWDRERIADWIEGLERGLSPEASEVEQVESATCS